MKTKLRIWDNELLEDVYIKGTQLQAHIENILAQMSQMPGAEIPHSIVPTQLLYELVMCNSFMYNTLLDNEVIKAGGKRLDTSKVH